MVFFGIACHFKGPEKGFLGNCSEDNCKSYYFFREAKEKCLELGIECAGITAVFNGKGGSSMKQFQLRKQPGIHKSPSGFEVSYQKVCGI